MFSLGDGPHCGCAVDSALLAWHELAWDFDRDISHEALKTDGIIGEAGGDEFLPDELRISRVLARSWEQNGLTARERLLSSVAGAWSPTNFEGALLEAQEIMGGIFTAAEPDVRAAIQSVIGIGAVMGGGTARTLQNEFGRLITEESLLRASRYYTNRYFRTTTVPSMVSAVRQITSTGTSTISLADIREAINRHFRSVPYWGLVANAAASRGYHYGLMKTWNLLRHSTYEIEAILDDRTSEICINMNGRRFSVSRAVQIMEALADDPDPEAVRTRTPWPRLADIQDSSDADLANAGVLLPPFHGRCRTTVRLVETTVTGV